MEGQIFGKVNRSEPLPKKDGKDTLYGVEIATASFLSKEQLPKGMLVTANFEVYWPKGGRPSRWIGTWKEVSIGLS